MHTLLRIQKTDNLMFNLIKNTYIFFNNLILKNNVVQAES